MSFVQEAEKRLNLLIVELFFKPVHRVAHVVDEADDTFINLAQAHNVISGQCLLKTYLETFFELPQFVTSVALFSYV